MYLSTMHHFIDCVLDDAIHIVTGYLCPAPMDYLLISASIQSAELHQQGQLSPWHTSVPTPTHQFIVGPTTVTEKRL